MILLRLSGVKTNIFLTLIGTAFAVAMSIVLLLVNPSPSGTEATLVARKTPLLAVARSHPWWQQDSHAGGTTPSGTQNLAAARTYLPAGGAKKPPDGA